MTSRASWRVVNTQKDVTPMKSYTMHATVALLSSLAVCVISTAPAAAQTVALLEAPAISSSSVLPDAPSALYRAEPAPVTLTGADAPTTPTPARVAHKYDTIILPGQVAPPLHGMEKAVYGLHDSFNLYALVGITASAGYSQVVDSQPHYCCGAEAFGKREGAAALRNTVQTMATDALFSPMFHDDPRYYVMGDAHGFFPRVLYAASRVVVVRSSHSTTNRINAPLLLGYAAAAGVNNAYYPDHDRGGKNTAENFGTSLIGAALGFEVSEFLNDALHIVHIRKD